MSRWLKSVNNILEKLDDGVETVAEDASNILLDVDVVPSSGAALTGLKNRFLGGGQSESEDGSYYDDEENYDDQDSDQQYTTSFESGEEDDGDDVQQEDDDGDERVDRSISQEQESSDPQTNPEEDNQATATDIEESAGLESSKSIATTKKEEPEPAESLTTKSPEKKTEDSAPPSTAESRSLLPPPPSSQSSSIKASGKPYGRADLQKAQQEVQRLTKQNATLRAQLEASQAELSAQNEELLTAAERIDEDRQLADEEREELMDEHEEALRNLKASYDASLAHQKDTFEKQIEDLRQQLATESHMRAKEGGDMTEELTDSIERERQALQKATELEREKSVIEQTNAELKAQEAVLREEVKRLKESAQAAADRERQVEERLDAATETHQRALSHRQAREAELERTVAELGAALAAKESESNRTVGEISTGLGGAVTGDGSKVEGKYGVIAEELDNTKAQLSLSNQKCEALHEELRLIYRERTEEVEATQEKEREYDQRVAQLKTKISHVEASFREYKAVSGDLTVGPHSSGSTSLPSDSEASAQNGEKVRQLTRDLDKSRRQIASLSDQLLRQQGLTESAKSEVLALRGRLQSAKTRAEAAEAASSNGGICELDSGGVGYGAHNRQQRRVKSGRGGIHRVGRTMRSTLGLRVVENSNLEQVAITVDAIDLWMLQTGTVLKHEPVARIALLFYLLMVHLWCFGLVCLHTVVCVRSRNMVVLSHCVVLSHTRLLLPS